MLGLVVLEKDVQDPDSFQTDIERIKNAEIIVQDLKIEVEILDRKNMDQMPQLEIKNKKLEQKQSKPEQYAEEIKCHFKDKLDGEKTLNHQETRRNFTNDIETSQRMALVDLNGQVYGDMVQNNNIYQLNCYDTDKQEQKRQKNKKYKQKKRGSNCRKFVRATQQKFFRKIETDGKSEIKKMNKRQWKRLKYKINKNKQIQLKKEKLAIRVKPESPKQQQGQESKFIGQTFLLNPVITISMDAQKESCFKKAFGRQCTMNFSRISKANQIFSEVFQTIKQFNQTKIDLKIASCMNSNDFENVEHLNQMKKDPVHQNNDGIFQEKQLFEEQKELILQTNAIVAHRTQKKEVSLKIIWKIKMLLYCFIMLAIFHFFVNFILGYVLAQPPQIQVYKMTLGITAVQSMMNVLSQAIVMEQCHIEYSNFFLVRETTCKSPATWFRANDNLAGTQPRYGILGNNCNYGIPYSSFTYDMFLIVTKSRSKWVMFSTTTLATMVSSLSSLYLDYDTEYSSRAHRTAQTSKYRQEVNIDPSIFLLGTNNVNLLYSENSSLIFTKNLENQGGMGVYIRDSSSDHFFVTEDSSFAQIIIIPKSDLPYIDSFPAFTYTTLPGCSPTILTSDCNPTSQFYYLTVPQQLWVGQCENQANYLITVPIQYQNLKSCNQKCLDTNDCENFSLGKIGGDQNSICTLFRAGCQKKSDSQLIFYRKLDINAMNGCKMAEHQLFTTSESKIKCDPSSPTCDQIQVDASQTGLIKYSLRVFSPPSKYIFSSNRQFRICLTYFEATASEIIKSQRVSLSGEFLMPEFTNPDSLCPTLTQMSIYESDCTTLSTDFRDPVNIISTLSSGNYHAQLDSIAAPQLYKFCIKAISSHETIIIQGLEFETVCDSSWIKPISKLDVNQRVAIQSQDIKFMLPEYVNTDPDSLCPPVTQVKVKDVGCSALQTDFENADDLMVTLKNGILQAKILNITVLKTFDLCFQILTPYNSIIVLGQLTVYANCTKTLSKVADFIVPIEQMYNNTKEMMVQLRNSDIFVNTDEVYCPITSIIIMNVGCQQPYTRSFLEVDKSKDIQAIVNITDKVNQQICVIAENRNQTIQFDKINFTQYKPCGDQITTNKEAMRQIMSSDRDTDVLFRIIQSTFSTISIDVENFIKWPENSKCQNVTKLVVCFNQICSKKSILIIPGASKNETNIFVLKFTTLGTEDLYEKKIIVETVFNDKNQPFYISKGSETLDSNETTDKTPFQIFVPKKQNKTEDFSSSFQKKRPDVHISQSLIPVMIKLSNFNYEGLATIIFNQELISFNKLTNERNLGQEGLDYRTLAFKVFTFILTRDEVNIMNEVESIELKNWTQSFINIQFDFKDPISVKNGYTTTNLMMQVKPQAMSFFISPEGNNLQLENELMTIDLDFQLPKGISQESVTDKAEQIESLCWAIIIIQFILQVSLKVGKDKMFDLLLMLQLIDSLKIYDFNQSAIMQITFKQLSSLIQLEMINPDFYLNKISHGLSISTLFNTPIQRFRNKEVPMVSGFFQGIILIFLAALVFITIYFVLKSFLFQVIIDFLDNKIQQTKKNLMFKQPITIYMMQFTLQGAICAKRMRNCQFDTPLKIYLAMIAISFAVGAFLYHKYNELKKLEYRQKYGMAYRDISVLGRNKKTVLHFSLYFFKRGFILLIPVWTGRRVGVQIVLLLLTTMFGIIFYGILRSHETRQRRNNEFFNESIFMVICYSCLCMTQFIQSQVQIFNNSYQFLGLTAILIVVNFNIQAINIKREIGFKKWVIAHNSSKKIQRNKINKSSALKVLKARSRCFEFNKQKLEGLPDSREEEQNSNFSSICEMYELENKISEGDYKDQIYVKEKKLRSHLSINFELNKNNLAVKEDSFQQFQQLFYERNKNNGIISLRHPEPLKVNETYFPNHLKSSGSSFSSVSSRIKESNNTLLEKEDSNKMTEFKQKKHSAEMIEDKKEQSKDNIEQTQTINTIQQKLDKLSKYEIAQQHQHIHSFFLKYHISAYKKQNNLSLECKISLLIKLNITERYMYFLKNYKMLNDLQVFNKIIDKEYQAVNPEDDELAVSIQHNYKNNRGVEPVRPKVNVTKNKISQIANRIQISNIKEAKTLMAPVLEAVTMIPSYVAQLRDPVSFEQYQKLILKRPATFDETICFKTQSIKQFNSKVGRDPNSKEFFIICDIQDKIKILQKKIIQQKSKIVLPEDDELAVSIQKNYENKSKIAPVATKVDVKQNQNSNGSKIKQYQNVQDEKTRQVPTVVQIVDMEFLSTSKLSEPPTLEEYEMLILKRPARQIEVICFNTQSFAKFNEIMGRNPNDKEFLIICDIQDKIKIYKANMS